MNIGVTYSLMNKNQLAIEQFLKVIKNANQLHNPDVKEACYQNLVNSYFELANYKNVIKYGELIRNHFGIHYIFLAWSYYFSKDIDNARKCADIMNKNANDDDYYRMMAKILYLYLENKSHESKIVAINEIIDFSIKHESINDVYLNLRLLSKEYEAIEDYKNLSICQAKMLKYLNYQSPFETIYD